MSYSNQPTFDIAILTNEKKQKEIKLLVWKADFCNTFTNNFLFSIPNILLPIVGLNFKRSTL